MWSFHEGGRGSGELVWENRSERVRFIWGLAIGLQYTVSAGLF